MTHFYSSFVVQETLHSTNTNMHVTKQILCIELIPYHTIPQQILRFSRMEKLGFLHSELKSLWILIKTKEMLLYVCIAGMLPSDCRFHWHWNCPFFFLECIHIIWLYVYEFRQLVNRNYLISDDFEFCFFRSRPR